MNYEERWIRQRIKDLEKGGPPIYPTELETTKHALALLEEASEEARKRRTAGVDFPSSDHGR